MQKRLPRCWCRALPAGRPLESYPGPEVRAAQSLAGLRPRESPREWGRGREEDRTVTLGRDGMGPTEHWWSRGAWKGRRARKGWGVRLKALAAEGRRWQW